MKKKCLWMAAFLLPCVMFTACGSDDGGGENIEEPPITNEVDAEKYTDTSYAPKLSDIQKTWTGEYKGYDTNQESNTNIKRLLSLYANKTYTNIIQGVLVKSGKSEYVNFELERGTYVYNERQKTITYTVQSDSILDYGTQKFDVYHGKKYYDHTEGNYSEKVAFSTPVDNQRSWITHDTYLQSLTDKTINIAFAMVQKKDKESFK